jgi:predicted neuraminidase
MRKLRYLMIIGVLTFCAPGFAAPVFQIENIFPLQDLHVHGSSIVQCSNGDFIAAWFHGSGERTANDVQILGARLKAGETEWSEVFQMADTPGFPDCNPVLHIDDQERLWLYWIPVLGNRWQFSLLKYRWSTDYQGDGPPNWDWQDVITLDPGEEFPDILEAKFRELRVDSGLWGEYSPRYSRQIVEAARDSMKRHLGWMTRIKPLVLPSGRILLPLYHDGFNISIIGISDDNGETWRASKPIVGAGPIQPALARKNDGTINAYMRDSGGAPMRVMLATSTDDGETWSNALDTDIPNPGSSLDVLRLNDGSWVMVFNDLEETRGRLAIALSDDEGETWKWKNTVEPSDEVGNRFGYPAVIQAADGLIHATYTYSSTEGKTIRRVVFNTDWIKAGNG